MVRRFKAEAAEVARKTELSFPIPMPERGLPAGAVMLVGMVLCVVAYAGWYRLSGEGRLPAETVTPIPERLAPLARNRPCRHHPLRLWSPRSRRRRASRRPPSSRRRTRTDGAADFAEFGGRGAGSRADRRARVAARQQR